MFRRKKQIILRILLFFTALLLCACGVSDNKKAVSSQKDLIVVGFSQLGSESDWRKGNTASMIQAFSPENGFRLIFDDGQQKQEKQITAIRNFINQGVDYIILAPNTEQGWDTVLAEAKAADIPVIIIDRQIEVSDPELFTCWVGSDFRYEGALAVDWMSRHLPENAKIVHLQGTLGSTAQLGRSKGFEDGLKAHPDWELVYQASGDFVQAKGQELVETLLDEGVEFNVIFSENDNMTYGAIEALKGRNIQPGKDVTLISFDASQTALRMIQTGEINLDVECNPKHGPRVRTIIEQLERDETPQKYTYVEEVYFDAKNVTETVISLRGY